MTNLPTSPSLPPLNLTATSGISGDVQLGAYTVNSVGGSNGLSWFWVFVALIIAVGAWVFMVFRKRKKT